MTDKYFQKFPQVKYANTVAVDITRRAAVANNVQNNPSAYIPYQVGEGQRPDHISDNYYGDVDRAWLVYMSTGIIDPYYGWPLTQDAFDEFMIDKYGSLEIAQQKILWWQVNWADDNTVLTPSGFASLPDPLRKYWNAEFGVGSRIDSYERRQVDWKLSTNFVQSLAISYTSGNSFSTGERVLAIQNSAPEGSGTVLFSNSSTISIQDVFGNTTANSVTLVGQSSGTTASVVELIGRTDSIPIDEITYWAPMTAYEYENGQNELRKNIYLIDSSKAPLVSAELRNVLNA